VSDPTQDSAAATLAALGVGLDQPLAALDRLEPAWGAAPEAEARVVAALGASNEPAVAHRLSALEARSAKSVRREIRRALYKLEQRGLWKPPTPAPPPRASELLGIHEGEPEAWLSAIDAGGNRLAWLARSLGHGLATLSTVISDTAGMRDLHAGETTRKALAKARKDLASRHGTTLVEAPWQHVDALVADAYERAQDRSALTEYPQARTLVVPHPARGPVAAPIDALIDRAAAGDDPAALAASGEALGERELAGWLLPLEWLKATLDELEGAQQSVLVLSPVQKEERARVALGRAIDEILDPPERRELYAGRLEETAYLLAKRGALGHARALVAAAVALRTGKAISAIPVLAELTRASLGLAAQVHAEEAREQAKSSLIVSPAQALAEAQARSRSRR
jgi:hypothetical protein